MNCTKAIPSDICALAANRLANRRAMDIQRGRFHCGHPRIVAGPTKDCLSILIANGNLSDHKHYPSLGLDEGVRMLHYNGIYLGGGDWPAVLSHVQLPSVDDIRYLLGAKASVSLCKDVQYGFFYLHFQSLDEMVTNSTFPSI